MDSKYCAQPVKVLICRSNAINPDPRVEKIATSLARTQYKVTILGWDRSGSITETNFLTGNTGGELSSDPEQAPSKNLPSQYQIRLIRLPIKSEFGAGLKNLPNLMRWQWGLLIWLFKHSRTYDIVHACDFDTVLPALLAKVLLHKKVVYDIFDFYADHLRRTPEIIKKIIRSIDLWAVEQADAVIIVDDSRMHQLQSATPRRWAAIYNSPRDNTSTLNISTQTNSEDLCIAYIGLLQVERGLFEIFHILERHPEWKLHLAGFGGDAEILAERAEQLPNISFYGRVPYDKALQLSAQADVLFATYDPEIPNHRYSSPNKVFEAMMLSKPVIVARNTNMDRIIDEAKCGIIVDYGNKSQIEEALKKLQSEPALRKQLGKNGRKAYERYYSWEMMEKRLIHLYNELVLG